MRVNPGCRSIWFISISSLGAALLTALIPCAFSQNKPQDCRELRAEDGPRLATGLPDSSYFRFARHLKEANKQSLESLQVCTTKGSLENLELLNNRQVEFAIVQGDVMHEGWAGKVHAEYIREHSRHINFSNLALVRRLFSEKLHIAIAPHSYVSTTAELKMKRVWLGPDGSGTNSTAKELLRAAGVPTTDNEKIKNYQEANEAMLSGNLDAIFRVTSVPVDPDREEDQPPDVYEASLTYLFGKDGEVRLLNLDQTLIDRLTQSPAYVQVPIYRKTYPGQREGVMTIGIEAMLISRVGEMPGEAEVNRINEAISKSRGLIAKRTNIDLDLVEAKLDPRGESEERALAWHVHPAAKEILLVNINQRYYIAGIVALVALLLALLSFRSKTALETLGGNTKYLVNGGLLAAACALFGIALWYYEGRFSFGFHNPVAAAQSLMVYFARGLKTDTLMTQQGQLIALLALAVIATLVHSINADALGQGVDSWSKRLARWFFQLAAAVRPDERHLVILNWDEGASDRAAEWMKDPTNARSKITIVSSDIAGLPATTRSQRIEVLRGDPKSWTILEKARVQDAKLVLVRPAWSRTDPFDRRRAMDVELADNYTIRAIHGIRAQECRSQSKRSVVIDAEICLESNLHEAEQACGSEARIHLTEGEAPGFRKPSRGGVGPTRPSPPN